MKKILIFTLLILLTLTVVSCGGNDTTTKDSVTTTSPTATTAPSTTTSAVTTTAPVGGISVKYTATSGGRITGKTEQWGDNPSGTVTFAYVEAIADEGYVFTGWSDGNKSAKRQDALSQSTEFTAIFKKTVKIELISGKNGSIDGETVITSAAGESITIKAVPNVGYKLASWSDGNKDSTRTISPESDVTLTATFEKEYLSLPVLSINTESGEMITSKDIYVRCTVTTENTEDEYTISAEAGKVKGRGNTSWKNNKKPYHIKFDNEVDLFGNGAARDWTVISNHTDYSMIRNFLAYSLGEQFDSLKGMGQMQFVDLYVNGQYDGVYLVCEQIEIHKNRIDLSTGTELDTGYIIEMDGRADGDHFTVGNKHYVLKDPEIGKKGYTSEHMNYIGNYVLSCVNALNEGDWEKICSLMDVESFAEAYIIFETHKCCDVGYASFYMTKDKGGKLKCGPLWDFDRSLGNVYNKNGSLDPKALFASYENVWFAALLEHEEFTQLVCEKLAHYAPIMEQSYKDSFALVEAHSDSFVRNNERWGILGEYLYPNPNNLIAIKTWQGQVDFNKQFLEDSLEFMLETYKSN